MILPSEIDKVEAKPPKDDPIASDDSNRTFFSNYLLSAGVSVYYSFKYRRQQEPKLRGTYAAR